MEKEKIIFVCAECGSEDVEQKMWVNLNTREIGENASLDKEDNYCNDCISHVDILEQEEYEAKIREERQNDIN